MKAVLLFTANGPLVILTSHKSVTDSDLLDKLKAKGIDKFIAYDLPLEKVKERYTGHYEMVTRNLHENDDLRVLDFSGQRVFQLFRLTELGTPAVHDPAA